MMDGEFVYICSKIEKNAEGAGQWAVSSPHRDQREAVIDNLTGVVILFQKYSAQKNSLD